MRLEYSINVTNTIKRLRKNVYKNEKFKEEFSKKLADTLHGKVTYNADPFGGWNISILCESPLHDIQNYTTPIASILFESINSVDPGEVAKEEFSCNIFNLLSTGSNSMVLKI